ncbi:MFS transporter [Yoonia sp.]|uniref:MFS transporter n=1 Tax=Yoonia sp. TaxID=2212373 RepID=UPI0025F46BE3|nr:MFS transporter [Yoonia sp.]
MTHPDTPHAGRWLAMAALLMANFINLIDVTIVNVALPSMQEAFDATDSQIEWVVAVYILTFALFLLPMGRLGDVLGRRRMFLAGVCVFTVGSTLCGAAPGILELVGARVVQGIGGAMMIPQTLAIVPALFAPKERGLAFALFGLSAGLAAVTGPVLGGLLIAGDFWGLGWRPIFLVNIPVGVIAVAATLRYVPKLPGNADLRLDFVGVLIAGAALLLVLFPMIEGRQVGWPWWCWLMMLAAAPMAVVFVMWERAQARRNAPQLIPASLFANRSFMMGTGLVMLVFAGIPGFFLTLAILLQVGNGMTPLQSGLTTLPFSIGVLLASVASGKMGVRWPRGRIAVGALCLAAGMIGLQFAVPGAGDVLSRSALILPLIVAGIGLGTGISPLFQTVLANVEGRDTGSASGALQAFQQVGGALGLAVMGEVFFSTLKAQLPGATDPVAVYSHALSLAILFSTCSFLLIAALVWRLPVPGLADKRTAGAPKVDKPQPL